MVRSNHTLQLQPSVSLHQKLLAGGVSVDWREPSVIRAAPAPLYNSFSDVRGFTEILKDCLT